MPEPTWVQVWSEEFNGSGLGGGLYIDDHCQHPEYVEVSDGLLRLTVDGIGCGADVRTFRMFEPGLAVEYRARATAPPGYDTGTLTASVSLETGADGVGPWIYAGAFRTYRMEWVDGTVVCYQDGSVVGVPVRGFTYPSAFLRIWAYAIDPPAPFRALEIDYVRVYHRA